MGCEAMSKSLYMAMDKGGDAAPIYRRFREKGRCRGHGTRVQLGGQRSAFNGYCMAIVQSAQQTGVISVTAFSIGLRGAKTTITCAVNTSRPAMV